VVPYFHQ
jgi:hypothetical protein